MTEDGKHTFKLKVLSEKGPYTIIDVVVNMVPFIVHPTTALDMVFLVGGTKTTLTTQDF